MCIDGQDDQLVRLEPDGKHLRVAIDSSTLGPVARIPSESEMCGLPVHRYYTTNHPRVRNWLQRNEAYLAALESGQHGEGVVRLTQLLPSSTVFSLSYVHTYESSFHTVLPEHRALIRPVLVDPLMYEQEEGLRVEDVDTALLWAKDPPLSLCYLLHDAPSSADVCGVVAAEQRFDACVDSRGDAAPHLALEIDDSELEVGGEATLVYFGSPEHPDSQGKEPASRDEAATIVRTARILEAPNPQLLRSGRVVQRPVP